MWLQFGEKRVEKRKTPIFKCTLNPVFNEAFSFNVPWEKIRECSLLVMVMDFDNIGRNELIGRIQLAGKWFIMLYNFFLDKSLKNNSKIITTQIQNFIVYHNGSSALMDTITHSTMFAMETRFIIEVSK